MIDTTGTVLVIGYGNPGRLDDGLGPALAQSLQALALPGVRVEANYQLAVEDAATAAAHAVVIFADAAVCGPEPFTFRPVVPHLELSFSSHSLSPEGVLALAEQLFGTAPEGYVLALRGYEFNEFGEYLSPGAQANLAAALQFMLTVLPPRSFASAAAAGASCCSNGLTGAGDGELRCKTESM